jgi:uroporphyrin-III C-methyltransferase
VKGKVYLVGAGPGDPDLLTLKALRLLKTADAVLHDDLVSKQILNLVSPVAQIHNVGKRCGKKKISQAEINFLMIALAESGLDVVRLKSGDPLIFGRGGEEIEALREAEIDCEIVPGVTAALAAAAAAQIPLTHRNASHAVIFVTAHTASEYESIEWKKLVSSNATVAIYMPGHNYSELALRLEAAGVSKETACAIISGAFTREQQIAITSLSELSNYRRLPRPALLVVGQVVDLCRSSANVRPPKLSYLALDASGLTQLMSGSRRFTGDEEVA